MGSTAAPWRMQDRSTRKASASRSMKMPSGFLELSSHRENIEAKNELAPVSVVTDVSKRVPPTLRRTRSVF